MRKLGLVAVIALAFQALSCETPVGDQTIMVRIHNIDDAQQTDNLKVGDTVFDFSSQPLLSGGYTDYEATDAGVYRLQVGNLVWEDIERGPDITLESGKYTISLDYDADGYIYSYQQD